MSTLRIVSDGIRVDLDAPLAGRYVTIGFATRPDLDLINTIQVCGTLSALKAKLAHTICDSNLPSGHDVKGLSTLTAIQLASLSRVVFERIDRYYRALP